MEKVKIPVTVDPIRAAAKNLDYEGVIAAEDLTRLASMVIEVLEPADVKVTFEKEMNGLHVIKGRASVRVRLQCQRCGEPIDNFVEGDFRYTTDEKLLQQLDLEDLYDAVELNSFGELSLHDIIEDELILSLPVVAHHPEGECHIAGDFGVQDAEPEEKKNPFAVLGTLFNK